MTFLDRTAHARVRDLSLGGARIEMPLHASAYDLPNLRSLHIPQIGLARVDVRWHSDHMIGVEFVTPDLIRQSLTRYFASLDPRTSVRPIGG
ncbi:PilZ domain-containing protein [Pseudooceanicola sp. LIPI14-2-Ac024]|uniref:PilZ domain-containing protein n=1 Tax=Pseudooceanicola sp. LIPI14-2-Ac024 TaxID=3344875 RepID=UPI0035CF676E